MAKVYLETSFFSACVGERRDARSLASQLESRRWWVQQRHLHELVISPEVIRELSNETFQNRDDALALTAECVRLDIIDEVRGLAKILVREKVMPGPAETGDAVHVATAIVHQCEYLLTWNVKHLANPKKKIHLGMVCLKSGVLPPEIVTPEILWVLDEQR